MNVFDKYLLSKDTGVRRRIEVDATLYERLEELTDVYDASINKLVNIAIIELIRTCDVKIYERPKNEISEPHNFLIRESSYKKLEELKEKYKISIYRLINIEIYNAINS